MPASRRVLLGVLVLLGVSGGVWLYLNGSMRRLTVRFIPEMKRLEAVRDGLDLLRRNVLARVDRDPALHGDGPLTEWAWGSLQSIAFVEYEVQDLVARGDAEEGHVTFRVGGLRADGARVERSVNLPIHVRLGPGNALGVLSIEGADLKSRSRERVESFPRFRDATSETGLGAERVDPDQKVGNKLIEGIWPGSGAAVLDLDGDGIDDLFVGDGRRSILYRNQGCYFVDVTDRAGLGSPPIPATGAVSVDYDGDGHDDLFVTDNFAPSTLLRNRGDGTFEDVTRQAGVGASHRSRSAAFADVDGNGTLDLFVCSTGDYFQQMPDPPFDARDGGPNRLFLNEGDGTFTDATEKLGLAQTRWSLTAQFADLDDDGWPDLFVTNDFGLKNLYRNVSGERFVDVAAKLGAEDRAYGMSAAVADFDGDGRLDLHTSGCYTQWCLLHERPWMPLPLPGRIFLPVARTWIMKMCQGNSLLTQKPDGSFDDQTERSGVARAGWCWSGVAGDLDNDGHPDLYDVNGMWDDGRAGDRELEFWWETLVYWDYYIAGSRVFERKGKGIQGRERNRYFRNRGGGQFEERSFLDGIGLEANSRAALLQDFDGDGSLDVYVRSVQSPETLFLGCRFPGEHFLEISLAQPGTLNLAAVGARVTLTLPDGRVQVQELQTTSGFLAGRGKRLHFGLGSFRSIRSLTVRWPGAGGPVETFAPPAAVDGVVKLVRGSGVAVPVPPPVRLYGR